MEVSRVRFPGYAIFLFSYHFIIALKILYESFNTKFTQHYGMKCMFKVKKKNAIFVLFVITLIKNFEN